VDRRTRRTLLVLALLLGISFGLASEPDTGVPPGAGPPDIYDLVIGATHATPLPSDPGVSHILSVMGLAVAVAVGAGLVLVARAMVEATRWRAALLAPDDGRRRSVFRSPARARRGPPAQL
jgi:hypothetical protein